MNKDLILSIVSICISASAFCQQQKSTSVGAKLIINLENDWTKALENRDATIFDKLLAKDFFYTENEKMYTRAEVVQSAISVSDTIARAFNEGMEVHLKEKTAIVTGWLYVNGKGSDGIYKRKYRFTDIWFNSKGQWKLIAAQDYLLPK
jgi:ketosteroid isomerase-like protein